MAKKLFQKIMQKYVVEKGVAFFLLPKTFPRLCNSVEIHNKFYDIASVEIWYTIIDLAYQTSKNVFTQ